LPGGDKVPLIEKLECLVAVRCTVTVPHGERDAETLKVDVVHLSAALAQCTGDFVLAKWASGRPHVAWNRGRIALLVLVPLLFFLLRDDLFFLVRLSVFAILFIVIVILLEVCIRSVFVL
jgi:hypothetical protein